MKEINEATSAQQFVFAGKAFFTIVSRKTGKRFTYRVLRSIRPNFRENEMVFYVSLLKGPDNVRDYAFLGIIPTSNKTILKVTKRTAYRDNETAVKAFRYLLKCFKDENLKNVKFYHVGRCGKCGRKLTVPESIENGIGPTCLAGMQ